MDDAQLHFTQSGFSCTSYPAGWINIYEHYGAAGPTQREFEYVQSKLSEAGTSDQLESFLCYWQGNFDKLDSSRPGTVRNAIRYDCSKVRLWYLQNHFMLEIGDTIVTGQNGEQLRFHSDDYKNRIQAALWKHNISEIPMHTEAIGEIIRKRQSNCP